MSRLDILHKILNDSFQDHAAYLSEKAKDTHGKTFEMKRKIVYDNNLKSTLYKFDGEDIFPFFTNERVSELKKMCDYIFFIEEGKHFYVYLIELKKGTESAKKQLDAAECFVEYIIATAKRLDQNLELDEENFHIRKINIRESRSNKRKLNKGINVLSNGIIEHSHPTSFYIKEYLSY